MPLVEAVAFSAGILGLWYYVRNVDTSTTDTSEVEPNLYGQFQRSNITTNFGLAKLTHPQRGGPSPSYNYASGSGPPPGVGEIYDAKRLNSTAFSSSPKCDHMLINQRYFEKGTITLTQAHNQGVAMQGPRFGKHHTGQVDITGYKNPFTYVPSVLTEGIEVEHVDN